MAPELGKDAMYVEKERLEKTLWCQTRFEDTNLNSWAAMCINILKLFLNICLAPISHSEPSLMGNHSFSLLVYSFYIQCFIYIHFLSIFSEIPRKPCNQQTHVMPDLSFEYQYPLQRTKVT